MNNGGRGRQRTAHVPSRKKDNHEVWYRNNASESNIFMSGNTPTDDGDDIIEQYARHQRNPNSNRRGETIFRQNMQRGGQPNERIRSNSNGDQYNRFNENRMQRDHSRNQYGGNRGRSPSVSRRSEVSEGGISEFYARNRSKSPARSILSRSTLVRSESAGDLTQYSKSESSRWDDSTNDYTLRRSESTGELDRMGTRSLSSASDPFRRGDDTLSNYSSYHGRSSNNIHEWKKDERSLASGYFRGSNSANVNRFTAIPQNVHSDHYARSECSGITDFYEPSVYEPSEAGDQLEPQIPLSRQDEVSKFYKRARFIEQEVDRVRIFAPHPNEKSKEIASTPAPPADNSPRHYGTDTSESSYSYEHREISHGLPAGQPMRFIDQRMQIISPHNQNNGVSMDQGMMIEKTQSKEDEMLNVTFSTDASTAAESNWGKNSANMESYKSRVTTVKKVIICSVIIFLLSISALAIMMVYWFVSGKFDTSSSSPQIPSQPELPIESAEGISSGNLLDVVVPTPSEPPTIPTKVVEIPIKDHEENQITAEHEFLEAATTSSFPTLRPTVDKQKFSPTSKPTSLRTEFPTLIPKKNPSAKVTTRPSVSHTSTSTILSSSFPTSFPSNYPSDYPSFAPSMAHSILPSQFPSNYPSFIPSIAHSILPSQFPSNYPSFIPSIAHSILPSQFPSPNPTTSPTTYPSSNPTSIPSTIPSHLPTPIPTLNPTRSPSKSPTSNPTRSPSKSPTSNPTQRPTLRPTKNPTAKPSKTPTLNPTTPNPTLSPTESSIVSFFATGMRFQDEDIISRFSAPKLATELFDLNNHDGEFFVHLGDFNDPDTTFCSEQSYQYYRYLIEYSSIPTIMLQGANDIERCQEKERSALYWDTYFSSIEKLWLDDSSTISIDRMNGFESNFAFVRKRVLFVGITYYLPEKQLQEGELSSNNISNLQWMNYLLIAFAKDFDAIVILGNEDNAITNDTFFSELHERALQFKPVPTLYVHISRSGDAFSKLKKKTPVNADYFWDLSVKGETFPFTRISVDPTNTVSPFYISQNY